MTEPTNPDGTRPLSRRQLLAGGLAGATAVAATGALASLAGADPVTPARTESVRRAAAVAPAGADLSAVKHVVFLMQENRSFDHYFGTMGGVAGFDDTTNRGAFTQAWPGGAQTSLLPFHMNTKKQQAECTYDLSHSWKAEHATWNDGAMDQFAAIHTSAAYEGQLGVNTMGYYRKSDIPFYWDLASRFTICDHYFCSLLGPTHPNRLMQMTGTVDPAGAAGGPILSTASAKAGTAWTCSWTTMPEVLSDAGITWKCYNGYGANYAPSSPLFISNNVLQYFATFEDPSSDLYQRAFTSYSPPVNGGLTDPNGPNDLAADVAAGTLPQVSWVFSPAGFDEHPPAPPQLGEWFTQQVLDALVSNPEVWASTVLFIMYDENDGFFDHVPPPTAPPGTPGEYLTVDPLPSAADGIAGPIGFGVRVPMLVVSPFSVGGWVCSDTFDHTSQLRFLEAVFGVTAPNISAWRRATSGDLTSSLPVLGSPVTRAATFKPVSADVSAPPIGNECTNLQILELNTTTAPFPVPKHQRIPVQKKAKLKPTPA